MLECVMSEITQLLHRMHAGDGGARKALFVMAYDDLCQLARARLRFGGRSAMLETNSLVHECYLRDASAGELRAVNRQAFFCYASRVMQSVILDAVRKQRNERHGGNIPHVVMSDEIADDLKADDAKVHRLYEALEALEESEPPLGRVILLRYIGGYSGQEIARTLGVNERTVQRHSRKGRPLLKQILKD
jgi:RNA polymerase sigma factor (TIGR02999 family)